MKGYFVKMILEIHRRYDINKFSGVFNVLSFCLWLYMNLSTCQNLI